jgi:hypothetical protein
MVQPISAYYQRFLGYNYFILDTFHPDILYIPLINFEMPDPIVMKLGMYIMTPAPISMAYSTNPSHQSVFLYPLVVGRQRIGKYVATRKNTRNSRTLGHVLHAVRVVTKQNRWVCVLPIVARQRLSKHFSAVM